MTLREATTDDAPLIAWGVMEAVGEEICSQLAGNDHTIDDVKNVFTRLATADHTQYSWRNTTVATDDDGQAMGICVSYDGSNLIPMRQAFFDEAIKTLGWTLTPEDIENIDPETDGDEFYLDSLAILPTHRHKGVGSALIADAHRKAKACGKPLGLLVDGHNPNARRLYESLGFLPVGTRPFAGVNMTHMQKALNANSTH